MKIQNHELITFEIDLSKIETLEYDEVKKEIYNIQNIRIVYDKYFFNNIIKYKKDIIIKKGIHKIIENGIVKECPMSFFVTRRGLIPRRINSKLCNLCIVGYQPENTQELYCCGHINANLPDWFIRTDIINNKYLSLNDAKLKIESFKSNIKKYSL